MSVCGWGFKAMVSLCMCVFRMTVVHACVCVCECSGRAGKIICNMNVYVK